MVFNYGHTTSSMSTAYTAEWLMSAVLPQHPNLNRFLGEFVSDVPDDMFAALTPDQKELGTWEACANRRQDPVSAPPFCGWCCQGLVWWILSPAKPSAARPSSC